MLAKTSIALGSFLLIVSAPAWAMSVDQFLNQANQLDYHEMRTANIASNKAGDNQAMLTYTKTVREDHVTNDQAVDALARQRDITLNGTNANQNLLNHLNNLNGGVFNETYLNHQIRDYRNALGLFEQASREFGTFPDVELYIHQSLPVLRAELEMAENLKYSMNNGTTAATNNTGSGMANTGGMTNGGANGSQMSLTIMA